MSCNKFSTIYDDTVTLIKDKRFDELYDNYNYLIENYKEDYKKIIALSKLIFKTGAGSNYAFRMLEKIIYDQSIPEDDRNLAKYEHSRGLVKERFYQKAFDGFLDLIKTSYSELSYIEIGRILFSLGYNDESQKAFDQIKDKARIKSLGIDLGRLNIPKKKYIAASYNFCDLVSDERFKTDALTQMMYLHIKNDNFEKAMEYFKSLPKDKVKRQDDLNHIYYYLVKNCPSLEIPGYIVKDDVLKRQIDNYDIDLMYNRFPEVFFDRKTSEFVPGTNLPNIFTYAKAYVDYSNPNKIAFVEYYYFDYKENVCEINGIETNRIKVGTLPNSKNIVSIHAVPKIYNPGAFVRKK